MELREGASGCGGVGRGVGMQDDSAASVLQWEMRDVLPEIRLKDKNGGNWSPQHDLLSSDAFAPASLSATPPALLTSSTASS